MKKSYALILALLVGVACFCAGYWLNVPSRAEERIALFQTIMGWDDAEWDEYVETIQSQMTPAEMAQMALWARDYMQDERLRFENDNMTTTITCLFVLKWLEQGKESDVKDYCIRRLVLSYHTPAEAFPPLMRDTHRKIQESIEKLAADVPALQKALANAANEK